MIDPNIWQSEDFAGLSTLAKLVFIGLFSNADDEGRGRGKATYIKSILFPYDENMRAADIDKSLTEISGKMSVVFYESNGNEYYALTKWDKWQRIDRPSPSVIPAISDDCNIIRRTLDEHSTNARRALAPNIIEDSISKISISKSCTDGLFERFWDAYPKKVGKGEARIRFEKMKIGGELIETILDALKRQKASDQWKREKGRYVPNPSTWLNQQRWEDDLEVENAGEYDDVAGITYL